MLGGKPRRSSRDLPPIMEIKDKLGGDVSVIIPAYNEEEYLGETLRALQTSSWYEIIVVDDGSKDNTKNLAQDFGVQVISSSQARGKAQAIAQGVKVAQADIFLFIDADLGESAFWLTKLYAYFKEEALDMAIGLVREKGGGFGLLRALARWGVSRTSGQGFKQPLSGQRIMYREVYDKILLPCTGFGLELALTIDALRAGYRLGEISLPLEHRYTKRDWAGFLHRGRQTYDVLKILASRIL